MADSQTQTTLTDVDDDGIIVAIKLDTTWRDNNQKPSSSRGPRIYLDISLVNYVPVITPADGFMGWREHELVDDDHCPPPMTFVLRPKDVLEIETQSLIPEALSSIYNLHENTVHDGVLRAIQAEFEERLPGFVSRPEEYPDVAMVHASVTIERFTFVEDDHVVIFEEELLLPELERVEDREVDEEDNKCAICLDRLFDKGGGGGEGGVVVVVVVKLPCCKHVFHEGCIKFWLVKSPKCPLCRSTCCSSVPKLEDSCS